MEESATIILTDENGKDLEFDHLLTFDHDGARYVALMAVDEVEGVGEDEVLLLRIDKVDGEDVLTGIDNEVLLEEVFDEFLDIMEEQEELDSQ